MDKEAPNEAPPLFIISGGAGALGKHIARIVLSQFPDLNAPVIVMPQLREREQIAEAVQQVVQRGGAVLHTMVDPLMREELRRLLAEHNIPAVDTVGEPLECAARLFGRRPLGQPGIYQGEHEMYLERIAAIEYTVDHDDGRNPHGLHKADVVLTGVSRVGKTPLSIYLSVLGWKVANVPLVQGIEPPAQLFEIDRRRVVALTIEPDELAEHRRWRQQAFSGTAGREYTDYTALCDEVESAQRVFRRGRFNVINVTNKPIEESADQVIAQISRYFEHAIRLSGIK